MKAYLEGLFPDDQIHLPDVVHHQNEGVSPVFTNHALGDVDLRFPTGVSGKHVQDLLRGEPVPHLVESLVDFELLVDVEVLLDHPGTDFVQLAPDVCVFCSVPREGLSVRGVEARISVQKLI